MATNGKTVIEFGDFQTPIGLARQVVQLLRHEGINPATVVEPTCGTGAFVDASLSGFDHIQKLVAVEINDAHFRGDFFQINWKALLQDLPDPVLVIGNPPWVTASQLAQIGSTNLPRKSNFQGRPGFDAISGKSNFDIAEWMIIHLLEWLSDRGGTLAMLVKQSVARKALSHAWKNRTPVSEARIYTINAKRHFDVSADACLLVCRLLPGKIVPTCEVRDIESPTCPGQRVGFYRDMLLADVAMVREQDHLIRRSIDADDPYRWRSGVKHDCAKVMELVLRDDALVNGLGQTVRIEGDHVYPMLKGSAVANRPANGSHRYMLVTQQETGQPTAHIKSDAPATWQYLIQNASQLDQRGSSIYRNRPRFSVFGVGPYTFEPWKIAICGLYKKLQFEVVGPVDGRPVVFDDTVYYLSCRTEDEARLVKYCLDSSIARNMLNAMIFWDNKRPITAEILNRLDVIGVCRDLGHLDDLRKKRPQVAQLLDNQSIANQLFS